MKVAVYSTTTSLEVLHRNKEDNKFRKKKYKCKRPIMSELLLLLYGNQCELDNLCNGVFFMAKKKLILAGDTSATFLFFLQTQNFELELFPSNLLFLEASLDESARRRNSIMTNEYLDLNILTGM